jgi:hypothetical protein
VKKQSKANVNPVRQRTQFTCMSTSMMMCLQANGVVCDEGEVNRVMGAKPMKGARWEEALACAQHYGQRATLTMPATVRQLKAWTDKGIPIMIAWNPEGRDWSHASVVFDVEEREDGLYVHVADPNIPNPEKTVRVISDDEFYGKWYEKWPDYLVRRPALAIEPEITSDGRQVMASYGTTLTFGRSNQLDRAIRAIHKADVWDMPTMDVRHHPVAKITFDAAPNSSEMKAIFKSLRQQGVTWLGPGREAARRPKGYPTGTNAYAVYDLLKQHGYVPDRIPSVDFNHVKRVLQWGGLEKRPGGGFQLTDKGKALLDEHGYLKKLRLAAYKGNPDGKPIYPNKVDHGYKQPLSGGTDVMKRLQDELLHEQGRPEREKNPRLAYTDGWKEVDSLDPHVPAQGLIEPQRREGAVDPDAPDSFWFTEKFPAEVWRNNHFPTRSVMQAPHGQDYFCLVPPDLVGKWGGSAWQMVSPPNNPRTGARGDKSMDPMDTLNRIAKFPKGVSMTVDEVAAVVGPKFKEMNEDPPESVIKVREKMQGKSAKSSKDVLYFAERMLNGGQKWEYDFWGEDAKGEERSFTIGGDGDGLYTVSVEGKGLLHGGMSDDMRDLNRALKPFRLQNVSWDRRRAMDELSKLAVRFDDRAEGGAYQWVIDYLLNSIEHTSSWAEAKREIGRKHDIPYAFAQTVVDLFAKERPDLNPNVMKRESLIEDLVDEAARKTHTRLAMDELRSMVTEDNGGDLDEMLARFEEGKPADPCQNMSEAECAEWKSNTEKHKDQFKGAADDEMLARFEKGKPADPTKNMSPEEKAEWDKQKAIHKDQFKDKKAGLGDLGMTVSGDGGKYYVHGPGPSQPSVGRSAKDVAALLKKHVEIAVRRQLAGMFGPELVSVEAEPPPKGFVESLLSHLEGFGGGEVAVAYNTKTDKWTKDRVRSRYASCQCGNPEACSHCQLERMAGMGEDINKFVHNHVTTMNNRVKQKQKQTPKGDSKAAEGDEIEAGCAKGDTGCDPTKDMSPEDKAEWNKQKELHKDQFKGAAGERYPAVAREIRNDHSRGAITGDEKSDLLFAIDDARSEREAREIVRKHRNRRSRGASERDRLTWQRKRAVETIDLWAAVLNSDELLGATDNPSGKNPHFWNRLAHGVDLEVYHLEKVPIALAEKLVDVGTRAQAVENKKAWVLAKRYAKGRPNKNASDKTAARPGEGLYGYTKKTQRDVEASIRKLQRKAKNLAKAAYKRDESVAPFLVLHAKRAKSSSAKILVAALKGMGPKVAAQMEKTASRYSLPAKNGGTVDFGIDRMAFVGRFLTVFDAEGEPVVDENKLSQGDIIGLLKKWGKPSSDLRKAIDAFALDLDPGDLGVKGFRRASEEEPVRSAGFGDEVVELVPEGKTASETKEARYGMYGYKAKTANLGLTACTALKETAGMVASDLHRRRMDRHAKITGYLGAHSKKARCQYARILKSAYPDPDMKLASVKAPKTAAEWLTWEE